LGFEVDFGFWFTVLPTGPRTHTLKMAFLFDPATCKAPLFKELYDAAVAGVVNFNNQDLPTNTAVQTGLRSRFAPRGRYSHQEESMTQINRWLVKRYRDDA
jgi:hypothetical protein